MTSFSLRAVCWLAGTAMATTLAVTQAQAGAFGLREQSASGLGLAFAGVAAGSANLSSMYWNPATMTRIPGRQSEWVLSGIAPYAEMTADGTSSARFRGQKSGDVGQDALLPASYGSWQINENLWFGLALNTPFGLTTKPDTTFPGRVYGATTKVFSFNAAPSVAYKVNDWLSIGAGLQIEYFKANYSSALPFPPGSSPTAFPILGLEGDSWGVGYTLGATIKPWQGGEVGIGFRSAVEQQLDGDFRGGGAVGPLLGLSQAVAAARFDHAFKATAVLPETVTLGLKQEVTPEFTAMAGIEWTNWSRLRYPRVIDQVTGAPHALRPVLPLDYQDGWFFSVGGEYKVSPAWTLRAGIAYEVSPVKDVSRSLRLPDNDRIWTSIGASYQWNEKITFDVAYAHLFTKETSVLGNASNPNYSTTNAALGYGVLSGKVDAHVDIVSVALRYRWDDPAKPIPAALPAVVRKP